MPVVPGNIGNMATELVVSDQEEFSDSAEDTTRVSFNVARAKQRAATRTDNDRWRRSLQSCPVESNEVMLEGLLRTPLSKQHIQIPHYRRITVCSKATIGSSSCISRHYLQGMGFPDVW